MSSLIRWFRAQPRVSRRSSYKLQVESLEDRCVPTAGALDATFGNGGVVTAPTIQGNNVDVAVRADGKIVASGTTSHDFAVARYNSDGSPDSSFGGSGIVTTDFGSQDTSFGVAIDNTTNKTLVAGTTIDHVAGFNIIFDFAIARYNNDGTLDKTFGKNGKVTTSFGSKISAQGTGGVVIQPDGKIVVAGVIQYNSPDQRIAVARYNSNGSLDTTFGSGGKVMLSSIADGAMGKDVAVLPNGKILIAKSGGFVRLNANGSLDTTFGIGGEANLPSGFDNEGVGGNGMAVQPDGKILLAGYQYVGGTHGFDGLVGRLNDNGTLDTTFGSGGVASVDFVSVTGYANQGAYAVAVHPDGKILLAGTTGGNAAVVVSSNTMLVRLNADGSPDAGFGTNGHLETAIGGSGSTGDGSYTIALQSDGRAVVAGTSGLPSSNQYGILTVVRYVTAAPQIGSFTVSSNTVKVGEGPTLTATDVQAVNPGSTITQVAFYADSNGDGILDPNTDTLLGYGALTSGSWTYTFDTTGWASGSYTLFAQAEDSDGVFSDALSLILTIQ